MGLFMTCYLALVLSRVLQHKLGKKYSVGKILESLSKCNCCNEYENVYLFNYYDEVLKDIGSVVNIDFSLKRKYLQDIKKFRRSQGKLVFHNNFPQKKSCLQAIDISSFKALFYLKKCQTQDMSIFGSRFSILFLLILFYWGISSI